ncbi:hypothetical protein ACA910_009098 [Epithemia clementina (nom. ined.)]
MTDALECSQVQEIQDSTSPVLTIPADVVAECHAHCFCDDVGRCVLNGYQGMEQVATAHDTCDSNLPTPSVASVFDFVDECGNTGSFTRTWTVTDKCGNTATGNQMVTIQDTTNPTFVTAACQADTTDTSSCTEQFPTGSADTCGPVNVDLECCFSVDQALGGGLSHKLKWTATDGCENNISVTTTTIPLKNLVTK